MRKITIAVLALASTPALADVDFFVGPRSLASNPAAEDLLGYAVAAAEGPAGSRIAVVGALAGFAAIGTMLPGEDQFILGQQLSSGVSGDVFGLAVAIGGPDGSVIAVGAPEDDTFFLNSGKVYLYRRASPGGSFTLQTSIDPPMPVNVGNFGTSVALSADGTRLVVGEPKAQQSMVERGAVHIYDISGAIGAPQTLADGITVGGRFGQSVALDNNRLVVGAPTTDDAMMVDQTGALMAYQDVGGTFVADGAPLFAADRATGDRLGLAVAINGDVLLGGAGNDDKMVGADAGSVTVFRRNGTWAEEQKLRSTSAQAQERFGQSVAVNGDEILVGAYCLNVSGCSGGGAVYRFVRVNGTWEPGLRHSAADAGSFGHSIAYAGQDVLAVGAFGTDAQFVNQGAVYALKRIDILLEDGFEQPPPGPDH